MAFRIGFFTGDDQINEAITELRYTDAQDRLIAELPGMMGAWNNFRDDEEFTIRISKETDDGDALGVNVNEAISSDDIFGRA